MKMGMCICVAWYSQLRSLLAQCPGMAKSLATPLTIAIYITPCLTLPVYHTSSISFHLLHLLTTTRGASFLTDWNNLPDEIIDSTNLDDFLYYLKFL